MPKPNFRFRCWLSSEKINFYFVKGQFFGEKLSTNPILQLSVESWHRKGNPDGQAEQYLELQMKFGLCWAFELVVCVLFSNKVSVQQASKRLVSYNHSLANSWSKNPVASFARSTISCQVCRDIRSKECLHHSKRTILKFLLFENRSEHYHRELFLR